MRDLLDKIRNDVKLSAADLRRVLETEDEKILEQIFREARRVKREYAGNKIYIRGLIEFSNICAKDCLYCGIRKSNKNINRFKMAADDIVKLALQAYENNYASLVLQGGEIESEEYASFIESTVRRIKTGSGGRLGITLSLGEQSPEVYRRWFAAGAHRYLLRIETSSEELYGKIHPANHNFRRRLDCLREIKKAGYQTGTGVMIGLPGQTIEDLAEDILFFEREDIDMLGMGPYIVHDDTPLAKRVAGFDKEKQLMLGLKMIAACRLYLKDVNIAAATALQALNHRGRELGVQAGANIVMPNITDPQYRAAYRLYNNKPCFDEKLRFEESGETIGYGEWGDSPHFRKKQGRNSLK
ncbi:MAG: [FeFe] hydrogenase H-cluster radical SAM maturase HydE [Victivallaceae bacterium]|nr:[FeFe] hydrogenase H-cluster radical SAM maturase HydE [Victivallaceae bacterium]